jgi:hypothetical protein
MFKLKGDEAELQSASDEFNGHCLALTLLATLADGNRPAFSQPHLFPQA